MKNSRLRITFGSGVGVGTIYPSDSDLSTGYVTGWGFVQGSYVFMYIYTIILSPLTEVSLEFEVAGIHVDSPELLVVLGYLLVKFAVTVVGLAIVR